MNYTNQIFKLANKFNKLAQQFGEGVDRSVLDAKLDSYRNSKEARDADRELLKIIDRGQFEGDLPEEFKDYSKEQLQLCCDVIDHSDHYYEEERIHQERASKPRPSELEILEKANWYINQFRSKKTDTGIIDAIIVLYCLSEGIDNPDANLIKYRVYPNWRTEDFRELLMSIRHRI